MEILPSARKHGVSDHDMLYALRHRLGTAETEEGFVMVVGFSASGWALEVGVVDDARIVHAMLARRRTLREL